MYQYGDDDETRGQSGTIRTKQGDAGNDSPCLSTSYVTSLCVSVSVSVVPLEAWSHVSRVSYSSCRDARLLVTDYRGDCRVRIEDGGIGEKLRGTEEERMKEMANTTSDLATRHLASGSNCCKLLLLRIV